MSEVSLQGRKGLVVGIANEQSIAWGCARAFRRAGAELAVTWQSDSAYAPKTDLHGRVVDSSPEGFALAMDTSCHSFIRMAKLAEPLMTHGGSLMAMTYFGAEQVVANYGVMGPVKAALEASVRYLAAELGASGIRVNAISPGALPTRAASGLPHFDRLLDDAARRAPLRRPLSIDDVGAFCAFLASDAARAITGGTHYVDAGMHVLD
jgi:enoyl-[acyl-carrier protein] reductase I